MKTESILRKIRANILLCGCVVGCWIPFNITCVTAIIFLYHELTRLAINGKGGIWTKIGDPIWSKITILHLIKGGLTPYFEIDNERHGVFHNSVRESPGHRRWTEIHLEADNLYPTTGFVSSRQISNAKLLCAGMNGIRIDFDFRVIKIIIIINPKTQMKPLHYGGNWWSIVYSFAPANVTSSLGYNIVLNALTASIFT